MEKLANYYKLCKIELGHGVTPVADKVAVGALFGSKQMAQYFKKITINGKEVVMINEQIVGAGGRLKGPCLVL